MQCLLLLAQPIVFHANCLIRKVSIVKRCSNPNAATVRQAHVFLVVHKVFGSFSDNEYIRYDMVDVVFASGFRCKSLNTERVGGLLHCIKNPKVNVG